MLQSMLILVVLMFKGIFGFCASESIQWSLGLGSRRPVLVKSGEFLQRSPCCFLDRLIPGVPGFNFEKQRNTFWKTWNRSQNGYGSKYGIIDW